jgi:hypothetical protein
MDCVVFIIEENIGDTIGSFIGMESKHMRKASTTGLAI